MKLVNAITKFFYKKIIYYYFKTIYLLILQPLIVIECYFNNIYKI